MLDMKRATVMERKRVHRMTEQQAQLLRKHNLVPEHWIVFSETSEKLVVLSKRNKARRVLMK